MKPLQEWIQQIFEFPPKKVLFRVDAGRVKGLSFGHAARCVMLANVMKRLYGSDSMFLSKDYPEGIHYVKSFGNAVAEMPIRMTPEKEHHLLHEAIKSYQPDWTVIDLPYDSSFELTINVSKNSNSKLIYIDDSRFKVPPVDVYLNSHILADKKIVNSKKYNTKMLLGPEFFIFEEIEQSPMPKKIPGLNYIAVTMGGSDPMGLTEKVISRLLQKNWKNYYFWVILGPGYTEHEKIDQKLNETDNYEIIENPKSLLAYMKACDGAICAGGRTMYELLYLGKPFYPIASAKQEAIQVREMKKRVQIEQNIKSLFEYIGRHTEGLYQNEGNIIDEL